ncbi:MAG: hypothetical protein ALECFALPRED_000377 [Alectoria fallacina]|uniref:Uncharacterized protein n=1 Tax=Alectoria fallacina TaxID=1903189 RepID=A0A8H3IGI6_9LECA|nr:MAG: hypothetical protein ALECFALPRED_000377 [Alectoria fallacina]
MLSIILRRAPRPTPFQGSRAFHLIHNLFHVEPAVLGSVTRKTFPSAEEISLKLVERGSNKVATMTLSQALQRLKPRDYLAEAGPEVYRIQTFPDPGPVKVLEESLTNSFVPWARAGRGKEFHLTTSCTPERLRHVLKVSYKFLLEGTRMEFHLHQKVKGQRHRTVDWALANSMHLRPDSILAAMPEGTTMLAEPAITDNSFKKRPPKNFEEATSQVMWAVENGEVLKRADVTTPESVKELGKWPKNFAKNLKKSAFFV